MAASARSWNHLPLTDGQPWRSPELQHPAIEDSSSSPRRRPLCIASGHQRSVDGPYTCRRAGHSAYLPLPGRHALPRSSFRRAAPHPAPPAHRANPRFLIGQTEHRHPRCSIQLRELDWITKRMRRQDRPTRPRGSAPLFKTDRSRLMVAPAVALCPHSRRSATAQSVRG